MGTKAKSAVAVTVTPKVAKVTKADIANAILEQSLETKVGLLVVTATSDNLNKFTKDALVEIVKVANPKFEVLKKTTKGEIIPAILKADERNMENLAKVIFTEENLMKLTKDVLMAIVNSTDDDSTEETAASAETAATEETPTPTDAVITDESVDLATQEVAETIEA